MLNQPKVSRDLLKQLLYGWSGSEEKLSELLRAYPELQPYYQVAIPMHKALTIIMTVLSYQLIIPGDELDSIEDILDPKFRTFLLRFLTPDQGQSKRPQLPDELMRSIIMKAEDREEALDLFLTIFSGLEYPDYLTEESYWLMSEIEPKYRNFQFDDTRLEEEAREMDYIWNAFLLGRCKHALRLCLESGLNKQVVLSSMDEI
jgi:hypothetical protein